MDTIAGIKRRELWLEVRCVDCGRAVVIPWRLLPRRLADDLPAHLAAAYFRCKRCGSKNLSSSMCDALADRWHCADWREANK